MRSPKCCPEDEVADQKITADAVREYWSRRFDYRRPIGDQFIRHQLIRMHAANFAERFSNTPGVE